MRDIFKKSVLAGLGTAVVTKSKVQETINKMVEQGKLSSEEAEQYTREILETGENEWKELKTSINQTGRKFLSHINLADKMDLENLKNEYNDLAKRVDYIESRMKKHFPNSEDQEAKAEQGE